MVSDDKTAAGDARDRAVGAMVGLAIGDALGTTLEFCPRDSSPPLTDMVGGGKFGLEAGQWTDDTSMALCLAESILHCGRIEPKDLMERFVRWRDEGHNAVTGTCDDIGNTTDDALDRFARTGDPLAGDTDPMSAGNGSLMRLSPVAVRWHHDADAAEEAARLQSRTTHAAPEAVEACAYYARLLVEAISGSSAEAVLRPRELSEGGGVVDIAGGGWREKTRDEIESSGYVIHTLEGSLWCVTRASSYREAVLAAANLGNDADTTAAVTGQLAGALWGLSDIPAEWLSKLAWRDQIIELANNLYTASERARVPGQ